VTMLGLDAATPYTAVAVLRDDGALFEAAEPPAASGRPQHAQQLLSLSAALLREARQTWSDVGRVAVGVGPGSYTGLRIALATARGVARARGARLLGVSTLQALAEPLDRPAMAVIDARRGEAFAALYGRGRELVAPCVLVPAALEELARDLPAGVLAVGDGALRFRELLEGAGVEVAPAQSALHRVSAGAICRLAVSGNAAEAVPAYLRAADAELALAAKER
jgi:tRNA threonylcarbamoyladenosine biosynthesis protein TsaB